MRDVGSNRVFEASAVDREGHRQSLIYTNLGLNDIAAFAQETARAATSVRPKNHEP